VSDPYGQFSGAELEAHERRRVRRLLQDQADREAFHRLGGRGKVIASYVAAAAGLWAFFELVVKQALGS